jgi:hypothetical protein
VSVSVPGLRLIVGAAPAGAVTVKVTLADGEAVTAKLGTVGNERLFAVAAGSDARPAGWTTYDAAGHQIGTGAVASATAAKSAKP